MTTGHCLCGACAFAFDGPANWQAYCHCESCRHATAAPVAAYIAAPAGSWRWTGAAPKVYESSPGQRWHFCPTCGSHLAYDSDRYPEEIHFMAALVDDPSGIAMAAHAHAEERLPWLTMHDGLPRE
ncbi:GFA family protein [Pseudoroseicyclus sp. CXY001]|uniref:GFA family protein n=1 Tax=Pseudoroseicyclus sp. CXY001 TaxID=3242492 RepID=UPI00358DC2FE